MSTLPTREPLTVSPCPVGGPQCGVASEAALSSLCTQRCSALPQPSTAHGKDTTKWPCSLPYLTVVACSILSWALKVGQRRSAAVGQLHVLAA